MLVTTTSNQEIQMTSLDFLNNYINPARMQAGESQHENRKFMRKVLDELDISEAEIISVSVSRPQGGTSNVQTVNLNYDQMMLVGMRESKAVRKSVLAKLKELQQPKQEMHPMQMIASMATAIYNNEQSIKAIGSAVEDMKAKVDKIADMSDQLQMGYISIKEGYLQYCNVCSYDVFREFAINLRLPMLPLNYVPEGTVVIVNTHQVKVSHLIKVRDHIIKYSNQISKEYWEHPDLNHKFKLKA